jgi:hypothetical protein
VDFVALRLEGKRRKERRKVEHFAKNKVMQPRGTSWTAPLQPSTTGAGEVCLPASCQSVSLPLPLHDVSLKERTSPSFEKERYAKSHMIYVGYFASVFARSMVSRGTDPLWRKNGVQRPTDYRGLGSITGKPSTLADKDLSKLSKLVR